MASALEVVLMCALLMTANTATAWEWRDVSDMVWKVGAPVAGGVAAVAATPVVLAAAGFGAGGVAVGSLAAKGMSVAWSSGVGVGVVGGLQSAGAAGLTVAQSAVVGTVGATVTKYFTGSSEKESCEK